MDMTPQIVGNAGLYYTCYQLSLFGWNAMPTSRNAKGVDILAYNADCSRMIGIQVKSLSKRNPVPLGKSNERHIGDFWVIVNNLKGGSPQAFIMTPAEVEQRAHRGEKDGRVSFWLQPNESGYDRDEFREAWSRIGVPDELAQKAVTQLRLTRPGAIPR